MVVLLPTQHCLMVSIFHQEWVLESMLMAQKEMETAEAAVLGLVPVPVLVVLVLVVVVVDSLV